MYQYIYYQNSGISIIISLTADNNMLFFQLLAQNYQNSLCECYWLALIFFFIT